MDGNSALQVGQGEGGLSIASIGSSDQVEKGIILVNGNNSAIAECPSHGSEVSGEHPDLPDKR
jgi:hypothetical protein